MYVCYFRKKTAARRPDIVYICIKIKFLKIESDNKEQSKNY